ncbi:hypothetical protein [Nocardia thraciensis]
MMQLGLGDTRMVTSSTVADGWRSYLQHRIDLTSPRPIVMIPMLDVKMLHEVTLAEWWDGEQIFHYKGEAYTRKRIILSMANRDGGTHVGKLHQYYRVLCAGEWALGITGDLTYSGDAPFPQGVPIFPDNAHLALLRQFTFEVLHSSERYKWA